MGDHYKNLSHLAGSNCGPPLYESGALPTELRWLYLKGAVDRDWSQLSFVPSHLLGRDPASYFKSADLKLFRLSFL